jgi:hypothetical protein
MWKALLRIGVAVVLVGVLAWLVPWRDRLVIGSRFGEKPLSGRIVPRGDGAIDFHVESGEFAGATVALEPDPSAPDAGFARGSVVRDGRAEPFVLTADERAGLAESPQPEAGVRSTFARLWREPLRLIQSLLLYVAGAMLSFQRWLVLLRAVQVDARFWRVQKLGFLGLFFSNIIPGMTGGDLVKAILVARDHPEQRPAAVLSVIVDRAIGLFGLALVASTVLLFQHGRFQEMGRTLNLVLLAIVIAAAVVLSRRVRRAIKLDKLLAMLPFAELLKKLDRAALAYREARWQLVYSVVTSIVIHFLILTAIAVLGNALGIHVPFVDYYALVPLALIAQSLPLSPGGIGIGEAAFVSLFGIAGVSSAAALTLSVSYRLIQLLVSLVGGVLLLVQGETRPTDREIAEDQDLGGDAGSPRADEPRDLGDAAASPLAR